MTRMEKEKVKLTFEKKKKKVRGWISRDRK